jgi:hypothetical protein
MAEHRGLLVKYLAPAGNSASPIGGAQRGTPTNSPNVRGSVRRTRRRLVYAFARLMAALAVSIAVNMAFRRAACVLVSGEPTGRQSERSQSAALPSASYARLSSVSAHCNISAAVGSGFPLESVPWSSLR